MSDHLSPSGDLLSSSSQQTITIDSRSTPHKSNEDIPRTSDESHASRADDVGCGTETGRTERASSRMKKMKKRVFFQSSGAVPSQVNLSRRTTGELPIEEEEFSIKDLDPAKILDYATSYQSFSMGKLVEFSNLEKFDDLNNYGIGAEEEEKLWRLEVTRLVEVAQSEEPILFDSEGIFSKSGTIDVASLKDVASVADQILAAMSIWEYDNVLFVTTINPKSTVHASHESIADFHKKYLKQRFGDEFDEIDPSIVPQKPTLLSPGEKNMEAYFLLVDHVTAVVAKVLLQCNESRTWVNICLAILGKCAAKLKVIEKDPEKCAAESLGNGYDAIETKKHEDYIHYLEHAPDFDALGSAPRPSLETIYYSSENHMRRSIGYLIRMVLWSFDDDRHKNPHQFEIASRVYRAGMSDNPVILSCDRQGEFSVTSNGQMLQNCHSSFKILFKTCIDLEEKARVSQKVDEKDMVNVVWDWKRESGTQNEEFPKGKGNFNLKSVDDIISIIVPGSLCDGNAAVEITSLMGFARLYAYYSDETSRPHPLFEKYAAKFELRTMKFGASLLDLKSQNETKSLSKAEIFSHHVIPTLDLLKGYPEVKNLDDKYKSFNKHIQQSHSWQIDEKTVTVSTKGYVISVIASCTVLILGGLAAPLSEQVHLQGVDPFNITTFVWLLVAFILLIAQSRYVPDWAWHDFLRCRIVCRTVSELANVTRVDPQEVLHILLVTEKDTVLETRGPYNSMFLPRGNDGFSVDIAVKTSTMYASGFILLHGLAPTGSVLICLDSRPDSGFLTGNHKASQEYIGCDGLPLKLGAEGADNGKVLRLKKLGAFSSEKLIGIFLGERKFG